MKRNNNYSRLMMVFFLLVSAKSFALSGKEYLEKINANYKSLGSFELVLNYQLYKGHTGSEIKDQYESVFRVNGKKSHRKVYADEIITGEETSLVLNHELKTIQILPGLKNELFDQDITASLAQCQDIKIKETAEGTSLSITFKNFSSVQYARIDLLIDADFWVKHMTLFYATQINYSRDYFHPDMDYPRLEIDYTKLKKNWKDEQGLTDLSNYITKEGDFYKPVSLYQNYEVIQ